MPYLKPYPPAINEAVAMFGHGRIFLPKKLNLRAESMLRLGLCTDQCNDIEVFASSHQLACRSFGTCARIR